MTISPSHLVKGISYTDNVVGSILKLTVQVLPELFLGTVKLIKGPDGTVTNGTFKKGAAKTPGLAEIVISPGQFESLYASALARTKLAIELEYNPNRSTVSNVFVENV